LRLGKGTAVAHATFHAAAKAAVRADAQDAGTDGADNTSLCEATSATEAAFGRVLGALHAALDYQALRAPLEDLRCAAPQLDWPSALGLT
jgi:hypothetical protein